MSSIFKDWLTDERIVDTLASRWAKAVSKRDKWQRWEEECPGAVSEPKNSLPDIFPPFPSLEPKKHGKRPRLNSDEELRHDMARRMRQGLEDGGPAVWAGHLRQEIDAIRDRACSHDLNFHSPRICPTIPDRSEPDSIRALSIYNVQDSVIISLAARFLGEQIDPFLNRGSMAHRIARDRNAVTALREIQELNAALQGAPLYVAECDIRSCFDIVSHKIILPAVSNLAERMAAGGTMLDPQINNIIKAYLRSYSFAANVISVCPKAQNKLLSPKSRKLEPILPGVDQGIPQGGALSGHLINIVLDRADCAVEAQGVHYWRYCDDSIILSEDRTACQNALSRYLAVMTELRLPVYPPADMEPYITNKKKLFWKSKTKGPYAWGDNAAGGEYPWLSFLGFQFKRDLTARLRPKAIKSRNIKISNLAGEMIENYKISVDRGRKPVNPERLIKSFRHRVLASSFGRNWDNPNGDSRNDRSWYGWAGQLHRWPHDRNFLKLLDRHFRHAEALIRKAIGENRGGRRMTKGSEYRPASFFHLFAKLGLPSRDDVHPDYKK